MADTRELEPIRAALAGRYQVERLLGSGGMATVYLAQDERHGRRVAVKVLRPELAQSIGIERFHREIGIAARLNHPHILPLLDSGTLELGPTRAPSAYYVMPYIQGESLRDRLLRDKKLPVAEAVRLTREIADALDHAHRHGVIHRDIKPENILLSEQHAVVADFGIARALDEASTGTLTHTGQAIGTPTYMSPEQISGERNIDGRTDLYALGCTLFEMLSGQAPWSGGGITSVLARRLTEPPPKIRSLEPGVPPRVEQALLKTLAREPDQRFNTPAEFAAALELTGEVGAGTPSRRGRKGILIAAVAVLLVAAFGLTKLVRQGHADAITSLMIAPGNASADTNIAYLSEGIQGEVADLLRRLPQLRVTAPSIVAQLRRQQPQLTDLQLGEQLKVQAVLTWTMTRVKDSLQVRAEVYRIPSGSLVWNGDYARPIQDLPSLRGGVARLISEALRLRLTDAEMVTMDRRPTASGEAYSFYLRGRQLMLRGIPLRATDAKVLLDSSAYYGRAALRQDAGFAQANGLLATYFFVAAFRGFHPFVEYMDTAMTLARRALATDSTLGDPYINFMSQAIYLDDDWAAGLHWRDVALKYASHDAQVLQSSGIVTGEVEGRIDSAIVLLRRSTELEPGNANWNTLGDLYMRAGRFDSAAVVLPRALALDANVPGPRRRLIISLEHLGRYPEAIQVRREGGDSAGAAAYEQGLKSGGIPGYGVVRTADLERQIRTLLADTSHDFRLPDDTVPQLREERLAERYAMLGRWMDAMDWIEKEHTHRPRRFRLFVTNPLYRQLWREPRFEALVRQEHLEALWQQMLSGKSG